MGATGIEGRVDFQVGQDELVVERADRPPHACGHPGLDPQPTHPVCQIMRIPRGTTGQYHGNCHHIGLAGGQGRFADAAADSVPARRSPESVIVGDAAGDLVQTRCARLQIHLEQQVL
ncbi:hypothetical protein ABZT03_37445 [Streptomyces sp. NPDC005574]|uniref:hypothetical protein n=1 Tax=Streptomyces sp. NPDC005574 TaxID=3156891 RepID=UPI0033BE21E9